MQNLETRSELVAFSHADSANAADRLPGLFSPIRNYSIFTSISRLIG